MGTRAAFFVGDPRDMDNRQWLGCIAFDGHPEGLPEFANIRSKGDFIDYVVALSNRQDFAKPTGGFPFPCIHDLFLTGYVYAWFNDQLLGTFYHHGFMTLEELTSDSCLDSEDPTLLNVPAPAQYDSTQPDSIMFFSVKSTSRKGVDNATRNHNQ